MKTYLDVINETAEHYNSDNRSLEFKVEGLLECLYNGPDGKQCAFARCCGPISSSDEGIASEGLLETHGYDILKPEYRHLKNEKFWAAIQSFHDTCKNWDENGLTKDGETYKRHLISDFG